MKANGFEARSTNSIVFFSDYSFEDALVGIYLIQNEGFTNDEATEWIECNTIPSLSYLGPGAPIIMHSL